MAILYKSFAKEMNLSREQTEKFNDLLADHIMENLDQITRVLGEGRSGELESTFAGLEAGLHEKVQALLGADGLSSYRDYSRNLVSMFTAEEFMEMLTGDGATKAAQARQLRHLMELETRNALASAGLHADYQTLPMLNLRNLASESEAEKNLKLLEGIYERVSARAGSFLSAEELAKFAEFRQSAILGNRATLAMNRRLMAPAAK